MPINPESTTEKKFPKRLAFATGAALSLAALTGCGDKEVGATPTPTETSTSIEQEPTSPETDQEKLEQAAIDKFAALEPTFTDEEVEALFTMQVETAGELPEVMLEKAVENQSTLREILTIDGPNETSYSTDRKAAVNEQVRAIYPELIDAANEFATPFELTEEDKNDLLVNFGVPSLQTRGNGIVPTAEEFNEQISQMTLDNIMPIFENEAYEVYATYSFLPIGDASETGTMAEWLAGGVTNNLTNPESAQPLQGAFVDEDGGNKGVTHETQTGLTEKTFSYNTIADILLKMGTDTNYDTRFSNNHSVTPNEDGTYTVSVDSSSTF